MKQVFLLIAMAVAGTVAAQEAPKVQKLPAKPENNITTQPDLYLVQPQNSLLSQAKQLNTLPNGNKIYALPQDNMPCVVPNMPVTNMPNAYQGKKPHYTTPNPAYPNNKPSLMTEEQLKKLLEKNKAKIQ